MRACEEKRGGEVRRKRGWKFSGLILGERCGRMFSEVRSCGRCKAVDFQCEILWVIFSEQICIYWGERCCKKKF